MMEYTAPVNYAMEKKQVSFERLIYFGTLTVSGMSVLYLLSVFITGNSWLPLAGITADSSELTLSLLQCLLGVAALHLPALLTKLTRIQLPDALCAIFYLFILCETVLGEIFSLYYAIPFWDDLLHCCSGVMAGMLGGILVVNFFQKKNYKNMISPMFIAVAALCFALCIGVFWEIYEFAGDSLLGLNMQKCLLQDGSELIGQAALVDTMKDLIVDSVGALTAAVSAYLSLKQKRGWLYTYMAGEPAKGSYELPFEKQVLQHTA
jgi:uncharacterized membrane protein YjdF